MIRLAVIGCGAAVEQLHLPALAGVTGVRATWAVDLNEKQARAIADSYNIEHVASDYRSVRDVDAVLVATPHHTHAPICEYFLRQNVHVLCEKPLALSATDGEKLVNLAQERGCVLAVGVFRRYYPISDFAKHAISKEWLGAVQSVEVEEGGPYDWDLQSRFMMERDKAGGGVLVDTGSHTIDRLLWFFDFPEVELLQYKDNSASGVESECELNALFTWKGRKVPVRVELSRSRVLSNRFRIVMDHGFLDIPANQTCTASFQDQRLGGETGLGTVPVDLASGLQSGADNVMAYFREQMQDFQRAISGNGLARNEGNSALHAVRFIERCYQERITLEEPWVDVHSKSLLNVNSSTGLKILVTGASGFLGCRLVEHLLQGEKMEVRAMAHRPGRASRLARLPVEIVWCDITDRVQVQNAVDGCDVVVHCAYGATGGPGQNRSVTVEGTRIVAEVAAAANVKRFIHVSSIAVHSYSPVQGVNEESVLQRCRDSYCRDKIDAEKAVLSAIRSSGLNATILRMGNIYGPFSGPWTVRPLAHIVEEKVCLVDGGAHDSNMVFVDNAVEAILLSMVQNQAVGEVFYITDDKLSWRELYGAYAQWLGGRPLESMTSAELIDLLRPSIMRSLKTALLELGSVFLMPVFRFAAFRAANTKCLASLATATWRLVPQAWKRPILGPEEKGQPCIPPPPQEGGERLPPIGLLEVYSGRATFNNQKAKRLLGYGPRIPTPEALRITAKWAEWTRLMPSNRNE